MSAAPALLTARAVGVTLRHRPVLRGVDLDLRPGEVLGLIGPNGAGKTTLLRALAGLVPTGGEIRLEGRPLTDHTPAERARRIGFLPQDGGVAWALPVEALVALGRIPHTGPFRAFNEADRAAVARALETLELQPLRQRPVTELSGGERARALLARVLAGEPRLLLADEPVAGLDPAHQLRVMQELRRLASGGTAVVVVLHDLTLAARFCDRLLLVERGRTLLEGAPLEVLRAPEAGRAYGVRLTVATIDGLPAVLPEETLQR
jgi:iron complex transport system ATP-binding protein